jgi:hypothetical protein
MNTNLFNTSKISKHDSDKWARNLITTKSITCNIYLRKWREMIACGFFCRHCRVQSEQLHSDPIRRAAFLSRARFEGHQNSLSANELIRIGHLIRAHATADTDRPVSVKDAFISATPHAPFHTLPPGTRHFSFAILTTLLTFSDPSEFATYLGSNGDILYIRKDIMLLQSQGI